MILGNIDIITDEGVVEGWCFDDSNPDKRVVVALYAGQIECGRSTASSYREDLETAGVGDGWHKFSITIPQDYLSLSGRQRFTLREVETEQPIGEAYEVRFSLSVSLDERLDELQGRIELLERRLSNPVPDTSELEAERRVFALLGTFLTNLGEPSSGPPIARLAELNVNKSMMRIRFSKPVNGRVLLVIEASSPLPHLHRTLLDLSRSTSILNSEALVLSTAHYPDAALINSLVTGHRFMRPVEPGSESLNVVIRESRAEYIIFVQAGVSLQEDTIDCLVDCLDTSIKIGVVAASRRQAQVQDDTISDASNAYKGLELLSVPRPAVLRVHTLRSSVMAFRRKALIAVGGIDSSNIDDLGQSLSTAAELVATRGWSLLEHRKSVYSPQHDTFAGYWFHRSSPRHRTTGDYTTYVSPADIDSWGTPIIFFSSPDKQQDQDTIDALWRQGVSAVYIGDDNEPDLIAFAAYRGCFQLKLSDTSSAMTTLGKAIVIQNQAIAPFAHIPSNVVICETVEDALIARARSQKPG